MAAPLFDPVRRAARLARARARLAAAPNPLLARLADDMAERLAMIDRPREAILLVDGLGQVDPALFGAARVDAWTPDDPATPTPPGAHYDAVVVLGALDQAGDLGRAMARLVAALRPDRPLLMASLGGSTGQSLRTAWLAEESAEGRVAARFHPAMTPTSLAALAASAGLCDPVVEVDRWRLRYSSLDRWFDDARDLALGAQLAARSPLPPRAMKARLAARLPQPFDESAEILHLLAWTAPE